MEIVVLGSLASLWLTYSTAKAYQIHKFNNYMREALYELYNTENWKKNCIDINKSYENVVKSAAWNFNFKEMIVYD